MEGDVGGRKRFWGTLRSLETGRGESGPCTCTLSHAPRRGQCADCIPPVDVKSVRRMLVQVAMMFLTKGALHHEASWRLWFQHAAGLIPRTLLTPEACNATSGNVTSGCGGCLEGKLEAARQLCGPRTGRGVLQQQHLFNVYIHALPEFTGKRGESGTNAISVPDDLAKQHHFLSMYIRALPESKREESGRVVTSVVPEI